MTACYCVPELLEHPQPFFVWKLYSPYSNRGADTPGVLAILFQCLAMGGPAPSALGLGNLAAAADVGDGDCNGDGVLRLFLVLSVGLWKGW